MSDDQFTKLFKYMQEFRREMYKEFAEVHKQFDQIYNLLDADVKQRETDEQERLVMGHQLTRHEQWFDQLAKKTDTKLLPER